MMDFLIDLLSLLPYFSVFGAILTIGWYIYKIYKEKMRIDVREATQEYAINQCRLDHGKKPFVFDDKQSFVLTIQEKADKLIIRSINTPNKELKKAIQLNAQLINEAREIEKLQMKERGLRHLELKKKEEELLKELKKKKKEFKKIKKQTNKKIKEYEKLQRKLEKKKK